MWLASKTAPALARDIEAFEAANQIQLPTAYRALIAKQNGGFIQKNHFKTSEPTSYGFDFLEVYQIFGLHNLITEPPAASENPLSGKIIYFSKDGERYLGFDYKTALPSILYADFETLQTLTIAANFDTFLAQLYFEPFEYENVTTYGHAKLDQMLLQADFDGRRKILTLLEDEADKPWFLHHIRTLILEGDAKNAFTLFENQILYFRRKLPKALVNELFQQFQACGIDISTLEKEWKGESS
ncbi:MULTISPECIES: SMI1/KNR4 family protein [Listeria]|uniref:SMI1/KNR4 family protein n=1 Tax=Listeria TaxID=1637 RepID=UPI000B58C7FA|nr:MULTISPECIES: SMI1/KNR4 family protein [Listeria]